MNRNVTNHEVTLSPRWSVSDIGPVNLDTRHYETQFCGNKVL